MHAQISFNQVIDVHMMGNLYIPLYAATSWKFMMDIIAEALCLWWSTCRNLWFGIKFSDSMDELKGKICFALLLTPLRLASCMPHKCLDFDFQTQIGSWYVWKSLTEYLQVPRWEQIPPTKMFVNSEMFVPCSACNFRSPHLSIPINIMWQL